MRNVTLAICLKFAYGVQDSQISGPLSLSTERYDIVGKAAGPVSDQGQFRLMMQSLLAERFHLVVHRENKEMSVYARVVAKSGPKFQKSVGEGRPMLAGKGTVVAQWATMKMLADFLSGPMRVQVPDMTGLEGQYGFKFDLMAFAPTDLAQGQEPDVAGMVLSGLEPQLGLKLESRKAPVEILVIVWRNPVRTNAWAAVLFAVSAAAAIAAPTFSVASIRPSAAPVQFERDGKTETTPGTLTMRDVTIATCIKWAYGVQDSQITGPDSLRSERYDIVAKADQPVGDEQMKPMMQSLLADRFRLSFHPQSREQSTYALTVAKTGSKLRASAGEGKSTRQNSRNGTSAKFTTMNEFADFLAGVLQTPIVNMTGLNGQYDFVLDFSSYIPTDEGKVPSIDAAGIIMAALPGELGLRLEARKSPVEMLVVDHVEKPSEN